MCSVAPASVAGSPEFIELICAQGGNERTGQLCGGSRLPQLQPIVDTPQVAPPLRAEPPPCRIEKDEAQHRRVLGVALLHGLQPLGDVRPRQAGHVVQLAEQRVVIGADLLVDLDAVVLDGDPVPACLGVLLHRRLDGRHLLWLDQRGALFDQGDHPVDALADRVAGWKLHDRFTLTLARATKVIAWLAGPGLSPVQRVRQAFAIGVADWHPGPPGTPLNTVVLSSRPLLMIRLSDGEASARQCHVSIKVTLKAYHDLDLLSNDCHTFLHEVQQVGSSKQTWYFSWLTDIDEETTARLLRSGSTKRRL